MTNVKREKYVRSLFSLLDGGVYISKAVLNREIDKSKKDLNVLLNERKKKIANALHHNNTQLKILFPANGRTDVDLWDIQMIIQVILNVFRHTISRIEQLEFSQLLTIRNQVMHVKDRDIDLDMFEFVQTDIENIIVSLASNFNEEEKDKCSFYIQKWSTGPIGIQFTNDLLMRVKIIENDIENALEQFLKLEISNSEDMQSILEDLFEKGKALRQLTSELNDVKITAEYISVDIKDVIHIHGPSEWVRTFQNAFQSLLTEAVKMAREEGIRDDNDEVRKNVGVIVAKLTAHSDVEFKGSSTACIVLSFSCKSYAGLLYLISYLISQEYSYSLEKIAIGFTKMRKIKAPLTLSHNINNENVSKVLRDYFDSPNGQSSSTEMVCYDYASNQDQEEYDNILKLELKCTSIAGFAHVRNVVQNKELQIELDTVSNALSSLYGPKVKLEASLDTAIFDSALAAAGEEDVNKKRFCIVKQYAWLKGQMLKSDAHSLANSLYATGHLTINGLDCIQDSKKKRRQTVESLLQWVLSGSSDTLDKFIFLLSQDKDKYDNVYNVLKTIKATDPEFKDFIVLERYSLGICDRPHSTLPRLELSNNDHLKLSECLQNNYKIDKINDRLLSRTVFSILEHTDIANCQNDSNDQLLHLELTLGCCDENARVHLYEILNELCRQKPKRKSSLHFTTETEASNTRKERRSVLSNLPEESIRNIEFQTKKYLKFTPLSVKKGSLQIQIRPNDNDSWIHLKKKCQSGQIKDFVVDLVKSEIMKKADKRCYTFKLTIYVLPKPPDYTDSRIAMLEIDDEPPMCKELEDCREDLLEELEITDDLLKELVNKNIVDCNIEKTIKDITERENKTEYLLDQIKFHGKHGYEVLKQAVETSNEDLYKTLKSKEDMKMVNKTTKTTTIDETPSTSKKSIQKEKFFKGIIAVQTGENGESIDGSKTNFKASLIDPRCFFEKVEETEACNTSLKEVWSLGEDMSKNADSEIVAGKRKTSEDENEGKKEEQEVKKKRSRPTSSDKEKNLK